MHSGRCVRAETRALGSEDSSGTRVHDLPVSPENIGFWEDTIPVQGYLAHKKPRLPRTLQKEHAKGSMVALGGWAFLMSEVPR